MAGGRVKGDGKGKTGGRKAGTPNRVSGETKEIIAQIVNENADKARKMLELIVEPKDWIYAYIKLSEFVVPKMAAVQVSAESKKSDLKSELEEMAEKEV